jgi:GntR family transcriptional regulator
MAVALPLPKYHQIYLVLLEQLREGHFANGLPSEHALSEQFNAGRVTVRRALEQLTAEGLITRTAGRGTWPTQGRSQPAGLDDRGGGGRPTSVTGLLENIVSATMRTSLKVIDWRVIRATDIVAEVLRVPEGTKICKLVRTRSSKEGPISYVTTYAPEALTRGFGRRELSRAPFLGLLEQYAGVRFGRAQQTVSARQADAAAAAALQVPVGAALLAVRRLVFDIDEHPVLWLHGLYRPDRYEYQMEMSKVGDIDAKISVKESSTGS